MLGNDMEKIFGSDLIKADLSEVKGAEGMLLKGGGLDMQSGDFREHHMKKSGNKLSNTVSRSLPNPPSASIINSSQNLTGGILSSTEPIKKDNKDMLLLKMKLEKPIVSPISNPNERMSSFNKLHKDNAELKGTTAVVNNIDNRVTNNSSNSSGGGSTPVLVTKPDVGALKQFSKGY